MELEYMQVVNEFLRIVDTLLEKDKSAERRVCIVTNDERLGNFKPNAFRSIAIKHVGKEAYRGYMRIFRTFEWIICKPDLFTNIQWIEGKSVRVVTVDLEKYRLIKDLIKK